MKKAGGVVRFVAQSNKNIYTPADVHNILANIGGKSAIQELQAYDSSPDRLLAQHPFFEISDHAYVPGGPDQFQAFTRGSKAA